MLAAWLCLAPLSARAGLVRSHPATVGSDHVASAACAMAPLAASAWWKQVYPAIERALSTRAGMLQFGAIMAALALAVIWWRK